MQFKKFLKNGRQTKTKIYDEISSILNCKSEHRKLKIAVIHRKRRLMTTCHIFQVPRESQNRFAFVQIDTQ